MGRSHFFTDRALIVRSDVEETLGMRSKVADQEIGEWIPCRLREPDGDAEVQRSKYELNPSHIVHLAAFDVAGQAVKLKQSDTLRIYKRVNDYWVESDAPFRIVGAIQPKIRRTRLISYLVPVQGPVVEY